MAIFIRIKKIFFAFTRREKFAFLTAVALATIGSIILATLGFFKATKPLPTSGGEYTEGLLGQPIFINPVIARSEVDKALVRLIFSNINDVAQKIDLQKDGRTWKVRLKENLHWQDDEKLTSDDVIFTVQKIQDAETSSPLAQAWRGVAAQRLSELELQFSLINPYAFFSNTLAELYIIPKHIFADTPPPNWRLSDYNLKPIGSGPYHFIPYDRRPDGFINFYKVEAWDKYFGDKPLVQNFNFQFFSKKDDIIKSFNSGEIDGVAGLEPEYLAEIKRPHETIPFYLPSYFAAFLNQSKSVPLKELPVRQALSWSTNRETLLREALSGHGRGAMGPIPPGTAHLDDILITTSSLEMASSALDSAGWKMNELGVREKTIRTSKIPLSLNLTVPQIGFLVTTANLLQADWNKVGFKINLVIVPPEEISDIVRNRDYEMLLFGNVLSKNADLFPFWHSSERFYPGLNLALYNNKKADALIEFIRQNLDDTSRKSQFGDLQKIIASDYPAVFLYSSEYVYVVAKNLHGVEGGLIAEPAERFVGAGRWYLKTARVLK